MPSAEFYPKHMRAAWANTFFRASIVLVLIAVRGQAFGGNPTPSAREQADVLKTRIYWTNVTTILSKELDIKDMSKLVTSLRGMGAELRELPSSGVDEHAVEATKDMAAGLENFCALYELNAKAIDDGIPSAFLNGMTSNVLGVFSQISDVTTKAKADLARAQVQLDEAASKLKRAHEYLAEKYQCQDRFWELKIRDRKGPMITDTIWKEFMASKKTNKLSKEALQYVGAWKFTGGKNSIWKINLNGDGTWYASVSTFLGTFNYKGEWNVRENVLMIHESELYAIFAWQNTDDACENSQILSFDPAKRVFKTQNFQFEAR